MEFLSSVDLSGVSCVLFGLGSFRMADKAVVGIGGTVGTVHIIFTDTGEIFLLEDDLFFPSLYPA